MLLFLLKVHFIRDNCYLTPNTNGSLQCTRVLWFKTFNPHKVCLNGITVRRSFFCARFLSFPFSFHRSMQNQISAIVCKIKSDHYYYCLSVHLFSYWTMEQWTFINLIYLCVLLTLATIISSHKVEDCVILQVQSGDKYNKCKFQPNAMLVQLVKRGTAV